MKTTFFPALLIFFCIVYGCSITSAQNWFPLGAKWHYTTELCELRSNCGYYTLEVVKDTFLLGKQAKVLKIEQFGEGSLFMDSMEIYYEEANRVYRYYEGAFHPLYDLSLSVGDTLTIQDSTYVGFIPTQKGGITHDTITFRVVVTNIDTFSVGGIQLARQYTQPLREGNGVIWGFWGPIMERIGPLQAPLGMFSDFIAILTPGELRCYEDSTISWKNPRYPQGCTFITNTNDPHDFSSVKIGYEVGAHELLIKMPRQVVSESIDVELYHISGQRVWQQHWTHQQHAAGEILRSQLPPLASGIYFCQVRVGEKMYTQKIRVHE